VKFGYGWSQLNAQDHIGSLARNTRFWRITRSRRPNYYPSGAKPVMGVDNGRQTYPGLGGGRKAGTGYQLASKTNIAFHPWISQELGVGFGGMQTGKRKNKQPRESPAMTIKFSSHRGKANL